jgi:parallel beta-helix repeat protein
LHTASFIADGSGIPLAEVTEDFDGETRDAVNPDIGADEYTTLCVGPMSGVYSLGTSGTFNSFQEVLDALYYCGMAGDITFDIEDGTYNTQILVDHLIPGQDSYSVTFQSESNDSTGVIIEYDSDSLNNYVLKLDKTDNVIFKDLTLRSLNNKFGRVVTFENGACNNTIENCVVQGIQSLDDDNGKALIFSSGGNTYRDTNNMIKENRLLDGSYGIFLNGNTDNKETHNTITGNHFIDQSAYGICADYQMNFLIDENLFENDYDVDFAFYAIKNMDSDSVTVTKNKINLYRDYYIYGISIQNYTNYNLIANNFISIGSNTAKAVGIVNAGKNSGIYYNSINVYGNSNTSIAIDVTYGTNNVNIKNNIFANNAGGLALQCLYNSSQVLSADYNNLYSSGEYIAGWLGTNISDLSQWRSSSGFGSNSVSSYPSFVSNSNLHTSNILISDAGTAIAGITDDIDDELRDAVAPDIGADEFTTATFNLGDDVTVCVDAEYKVNAA